MNVKELLLNGNSFLMLLQQHAVDIADVKIKDEEVIVDHFMQHPQVSKESICIEGRNENGVINFFGTLHYNLLNKLAVFEMHGFEQISKPQVC